MWRRQRLWARRVLVVVPVALLTSTACSPRPGTQAALTMDGCPSALSQELARFAPELAPKVALECGELTVPLDYSRPTGAQIRLQVLRARHREQTDRIGTVVFHPGGPGQAGVDYAPFLLSWLPERLLQRFDLVTLDPRGTGGSAPINCPTPPEDPDPSPPDVLTAAGFARAARAEQLRARACSDTLADRAPHFSTQTAAKDVDQLREAVGDPALTFLGLSYGAKLGAEYAHQFPRSVRAAVLDGPSAPSSTLFDNIVWQLDGMEDAFNQYADNCSARPTCRLGDPRAFVTRLVAHADASPIPSHRAGDDRPANGTVVLDGVRAALLDKALWSELDQTLFEASADSDSGGLRALAENVFDPAVEDSAPADARDANYVINCNDSAPGPTEEAIRAGAREMARRSPLFGSHTAPALFTCKAWQPRRAFLDRPVAPTPNRLLVVGTVHDAATPYAGAMALTEALGNATLVTWNGANHTATAFSPCIADIVTRYLIDLTVPPDGTTCPP